MVKNMAETAASAKVASEDSIPTPLNNFNGYGTAKAAKLAKEVASGKELSIDEMSERQFAKYMTDYENKLNIEADSSKYQRAYEDIKKLGLNPRLILDSLDTGNVHTSSAYSYSEGRSQSQSNSVNTSVSAIIASLIAVVLAAL